MRADYLESNYYKILTFECLLIVDNLHNGHDKLPCMEPITASIVTALTAGATAGLKGFATDAVKDSYEGLKNLIVSRFHDAGPVIKTLEVNPDSKSEQTALADKLRVASSDLQAKQAAALLLKALEELEKEPRAQAVFDFGKLRAAKNFVLKDVDFSGTLIKADEATFEDNFIATNIHQKQPEGHRGN